MRTLLLTSIAASVLSVAAPGCAYAVTLVRLDFTGPIEANSLFTGADRNTVSNAPNLLNGLINVAPGPMSAVTGSLTYDASTTATSPGLWTLPTATYQATFGELTINAVGLTASVASPNSAITFQFAIPLSEFPFPVTSAFGSLQIQTLRTNAFDPLTLPTVIPTGAFGSRPDTNTTFSYTTTAGLNGLVNSGTNIGLRATVIDNPVGVPEPTSLLLFGAGLLTFAGTRRRPSRLGRVLIRGLLLGTGFG